MDYEILEHTADIGIRASADSLEALFEAATRGLAAVAGVWKPSREGAEEAAIEIEPHDLAGLLVDWLSEVLYLHDSRSAAITAIHLESVDPDTGARGRVALAPLGEGDAEGVQVKAVTYHQLKVERAGGGYLAEVYLDI